VGQGFQVVTELSDTNWESWNRSPFILEVIDDRVVRKPVNCKVYKTCDWQHRAEHDDVTELHNELTVSSDQVFFVLLLEVICLELTFDDVSRLLFL